MLFVITVDAISGIWKAFLNKSFTSKKLPRILIISIVYVTVLAISWNVTKFSPLFFWLPGMVYGGLIGTLIFSLYENLADVGYLPKGLLYNLKDKLNHIIKQDKKED